jgi:hypothetical protein
VSCLTLRAAATRVLEAARRGINSVLLVADIAAIERAVPKDAAAGTRYPAHATADLDSERW